MFHAVFLLFFPPFFVLKCTFDLLIVFVRVKGGMHLSNTTGNDATDATKDCLLGFECCHLLRAPQIGAGFEDWSRDGPFLSTFSQKHGPIVKQLAITITRTKQNVDNKLSLQLEVSSKERVSLAQ